jgi:NADPH:quinone reductase-like Zn-dependent oxidoreductase
MDTIPTTRPRTSSSPREREVRVTPLAHGSMRVARIDAMGADTTGFARGDRVAHTSRDAAARVLNTAGLVGVPKDVTDAQAAWLLAPTVIVRHLLRHVRPVTAGDRVALAVAPGMLRQVAESLLEAQGALVVEAGQPADVVIDEAAMRAATRGVPAKHGKFAQAAADAFTVIRSGSLDGFLPSRPQHAAA